MTFCSSRADLDDLRHDAGLILGGLVLVLGVDPVGGVRRVLAPHALARRRRSVSASAYSDEDALLP